MCFIHIYQPVRKLLLLLFSDGGPKTHILEVGKQYYFGFELELAPIRTMFRGLCYKLEISNGKSLPLTLIVTSSSKAKDKLKKVHLFLTAKNTWQGTIPYNWPYSKVPPYITGELNTESYKLMHIELKENQWHWRSGISDFDSCMNDGNASECSSIFDPTPCEHQKK